MLFFQLSQQLQFELKQEVRSNCGKYSLESSINIIMQYLTQSIRDELSMRVVTLPFLQSFPYEIRMIGMISFT